MEKEQKKQTPQNIKIQNSPTSYHNATGDLKSK